MTDQNVKANEDAAIADHARAKWTLGNAQKRLTELATEMQNVADAIVSQTAEDLSTFEFHPFSWLNAKEIRDRAKDVVKASEDVESARVAASTIGVSVS
jgi:hypothetical protein